LVNSVRPGRSSGAYTVNSVFLLAALLLGLAALPVRAAVVTWSGGDGDNKWYTPNNWSPVGIPAATDDVTINANVNVSVDVSSPSINFNTLALGSAGGTFFPQLILSTTIASGGSLTIYKNARLVQRSTETLRLSGNLTVEKGGIITSSDNTTARNYIVSFDVGGTFDLQAGSTITVDYLGYDGSVSNSDNGFGPGGGTTGWANGGGGGGGHGGAGGAGGGAEAPGGIANDLTVTDLGSGGGRGFEEFVPGGSGGGAVILTAAALILNGYITAKGQIGTSDANYGAGGGSGGSVNLIAGNFSGNGVIVASGAAGGFGGNSDGGGGGGGRILISITGTGNPCALTTNVRAGTGYNSGSAGTVSLPGIPGIEKMWLGGGSNWYTAGNWSPAGAPSSTDDVMIGPDALVTVHASSPPINFQTLTLGSCQPGSASLTVGSSLGTAGGVTLLWGSALTLNGVSNEQIGGNLLLSSGSVLTINNAGNMVVTGTVTLNASNLVANNGIGPPTGNLVIGGSVTLNGASDFNAYVDTLTLGGDVKIGASAKLTPTAYIGMSMAGNLVIPSGGTLLHGSTTVFRIAGNLTVEKGGKITHADNSGEPAIAKVNLDVGGTFDLQTGSSITVAGLGYDGSSTGNGYGTGGGGMGSASGGGGGHGGAGGIGNGGAGGIVYDLQATDLGSGGGKGNPSVSGGAGGGAVIIKAGILTFNGYINANGAIGFSNVTYGGGGGSGGSVNITATNFSGNGVIVASGAAGGPGSTNNGGGGGGGRIFINITDTGDPCTLNTNVFGGTGYAGGAAGTVLRQNTASVDKIWMGSGGDSNWYTSMNWYPEGVPSEIDDVMIGPGANVMVNASSPAINFFFLELGSNMGCNMGMAFLTLSTGIASAYDMTIHNKATFIQKSTETLRFEGDVTVEQGGIITHTDNSTLRNYMVNLVVGGIFYLQEGSTITVAGLGYDGSSSGAGYGPGPGGAGSYSGGGGGHGGAGGGGYLSSGGLVNDLSSTDLGSGGAYGNPAVLGGSGGGAVSLKADILRLDGYITANGQAGANGGSYGAGGGAGGSVNITATSSLGAGVIVASGAAGGTGGGNPGGGGGGGRISVNIIGSDDPCTFTANATGGTGYVGGAAGIVSRLNILGTGNMWLGSGGDTNWYTAGNWYPATVPMSTTDVIIPPGANVTVSASSPAVNFQTLELGESGGCNAGTASLTLSTGILSGGSITIHKRAAFIQSSTETLRLGGNVTMERGGIITHSDNTGLRSYVVNLDVAGMFDLQAGSTITVDSLGYDGSSSGNGAGPGGGEGGNVSYSGSGGGHGGAGGNSFLYDGGIANDMSSLDLGSGGGAGGVSKLGGAGGGAVLLKAGILTLNGYITANGQTGVSGGSYGAGGGAGGSVNIFATNFSGNGVIVATGAAGGTGSSFDGGGGGGGRIFINVTGTGNPCTLTTNVSGGDRGYLSLGALGTVSRSNIAGMEKVWFGGNGGSNWYTANNWYPSGVPSPSDDVMIAPGIDVTVSASSPAINFQILQIGDSAGCSIGTASLTLSTGILSGGSITIHKKATFIQSSTETLRFGGNMTVEKGGIITHGDNSASRSYMVNLDVAGTFDLQAGSTITVDYMGYDGSSSGNGYGPGRGEGGIVSYSGSGGGHGGAGGNSFIYNGGVANDMPSLDLGSGGGAGGASNLGGAGGGAVILKAGTLTLNGHITANGLTGGGGAYGAGSGAGGSVNIFATNFSGNGVIVASGAAGGAGSTYDGGGGGGGRIFINVTSVGNPCTLTTNVSGGDKGYLSRGAFGTVSRSNIAGLEKMWLGSAGGDNWYTANNWYSAGVPSSLDDVMIGPGIDVTVSASSPAINFQSLQLGIGGGCNIGTASLTLSTSIASGGSVTIHDKAALVQSSTLTLSLSGNLTVEKGGIITSSDNATARNYVVNIDVAGMFDLQAGSTVTVDYLGYDGSRTGNGAGPGYGYGSATSGGGGGGHGGAGGSAFGGASGGIAYDLQNTDLGGGGGGGYAAYLGGSGGGAVIFKSANFNLNGLITANGKPGESGSTNGGGGGGAGGSINVTVTNLSGSGVIVASGAAGGHGSGNDAGGGGGGRIYLNITGNGDSGKFITSTSVAGGNCDNAGIAGVVSLLNNVPGFAGAPPSHSFAGCGFPDTGQKTCYDTAGNPIGCPSADAALAQDGTYSLGALQLNYTVYNPVDVSSVTVDNRTGLMWITNPNTDASMFGPYTWESAITACEDKIYANYSDWRLPNFRELLSTVNYQINLPAVNVTAFPGTQNNYYWTSTTYVPDTASAWAVSFNDGNMHDEVKTVAHYVRCVRGGP